MPTQILPLFETKISQGQPFELHPADEPDYTRRLGLLRGLWQSYRRNLPALRRLILEALEREALSWDGDR